MPDSPELPLASRWILVVDDQPSILGVLKTALREAGADVTCAADGPAALAILQATVPDLILLDLSMPEMSGWQVLDILSRSPRTAAIPVILQTSAEDFGSFERARKQGVAAFLSKPFRLDHVVEACRRVLDGARPLQGTAAKASASPPVLVGDAEGRLLTIGRLLDLSPGGAQVELERPLGLGDVVNLTIQSAEGSVKHSAEVRWVSRAGDRFQHGLLIRADQEG